MLSGCNVLPVPPPDATENEAKKNPRAKREDMFKFIFEDLKYAEESLADFETTTPVYPELPAIYGMYARAYMWLGQFNKDYASKEGYEMVLTGEEAYKKALYYAEKSIELANVPMMTREEWSSTTSAFNTVVPSWIWSTMMSFFMFFLLLLEII